MNAYWCLVSNGGADSLFFIGTLHWRIGIQNRYFHFKALWAPLAASWNKTLLCIIFSPILFWISSRSWHHHKASAHWRRHPLGEFGSVGGITRPCVWATIGANFQFVFMRSRCSLYWRCRCAAVHTKYYIKMFAKIRLKIPLCKLGWNI